MRTWLVLALLAAPLVLNVAGQDAPAEDGTANSEQAVAAGPVAQAAAPQGPVETQSVDSAAGSESATGIIAAQGTKFVDKDCHEYVYSGANVWQIIEAQGGVDGGEPAHVQQMFESAKKRGINVLRFFPFGIFDRFALQTAPGQYNPKGWDALDAVIKQAADAEIKLVMPFADNWTPNNGKIQYALWWGGKSDPDAFYKDEGIKTMYKNHIEAMANHMNPLTNRKYKDEPAIFAWELMNEMRSSCDTSKPNVSCTAEATAYMQAWVEEMAAHTKKVDPNHMVTVGEEGFYPASNPKAADFNPGQKFAVGSGQDWVGNHRPAEIDYLATHIWIDNWQTNSSFCGQNENPRYIATSWHVLSGMLKRLTHLCGPEFITRWLKSHMEDANNLGKPFVVEEFGNDGFANVDYAVRNQIYAAVYEPYMKALQDDAVNLRGAAFWQWEFSKGLDPTAMDHGYVVVTDDETWKSEISKTFQPTQDYLAAKKTVSGCIPGPIKAQTSNAPSGGSSASATPGRRLLAV